MSEYRKLKKSKLDLKVKENCKELVITLISCMCDNKYIFKLKKDLQGEFKLNTCGYAFSNFGIKNNRYEIEWAADESNWEKVFEMINTGTSIIKSVVSR
jgi:hypothetical protein